MPISPQTEEYQPVLTATLVGCKNHPDRAATHIIVQTLEQASGAGMYVHGECDECNPMAFWSEPGNVATLVERVYT